MNSSMSSDGSALQQVASLSHSPFWCSGRSWSAAGRRYNQFFQKKKTDVMTMQMHFCPLLAVSDCSSHFWPPWCFWSLFVHFLPHLSTYGCFGHLCPLLATFFFTTVGRFWLPFLAVLSPLLGTFGTFGHFSCSLATFDNFLMLLTFDFGCHKLTMMTGRPWSAISALW